jgi:RimJ/RimL family protein N-acetyltransferase
MLRTERLVLRGWREEDFPPFAALNTDAEVMEFFPKTLSREESDEMATRLQAKILERGWGLWAVEEVASGEFMGFVGLAVPRFEAGFTPCVEIGWRLAKNFWGKGYASEGAWASLEFAFERAGLSEIVSFTAVQNVRSQRVMERIGMRRDGEFDHPELEAGHWLRRHVLYRITGDGWLEFDRRAHGQDARGTVGG